MDTQLVGYYDNEQQELLWWLTVGFSILSMIGQILIFCTFVCLKMESPISDHVEKDKARSVHIFIACISFYDFIRIIGKLTSAHYPYSKNKDGCIAESVLVTFGAITSFILVGLISIIMIIAVFKQSKATEIIQQIHKMRAIILTVITILSLLGAWIPINYWCSAEYHRYLR